MKTFLFLIVALLFINMAMAGVKQKRAVTAEPIVFEVEVRAPCEAYLPIVLSSIQISSFSSPGCLPINLTNPFVGDINDRNSHVFCRNIDFDTRSIFYFHEIFPGTDEDETPAPGEIFIVSWISPVHFIERSRHYTYLRKPDCNVEDDLCTNFTIVGYCKDKPVSFLNGYVATTDDRIYFIPPNVQVGTCTLDDKCCPYVNTLPTGICGGKGDACTFLNCNDSLICTIDSCSQGRCMHDPLCTTNDACLNPTCDSTTGACGTTPKCSTNNVCKTVVCNNGVCSYPDKCTTNDACLNPTCDSITGDCGTTPKCSTNDVCKTVVCNNGVCSYPDKCTSADPCLLPTCDSTGDCGTTPKCTSNDLCKAPGCYANGTCYLTDTCISTNSCRIATCNSADGSCTISEKCTSNDPCKAPGCYANGTCYLTDTCISTNSCKIATCNSTDGTCTITDKCISNDLCTIASCDQSTGSCSFVAKDCSDSKFCTTNERCNSTDGLCYSDVTDCSGPLATNKCILSAVCDTVSDSCQYTNVTCPADNACYLNSVCNTTTGICAYKDRTVCFDGLNCTDDRCNNNTGCFFPRNCFVDGNPCTVDYCLEAGLFINGAYILKPGFCSKDSFCQYSYDPANNACQNCSCMNEALCPTINETLFFTIEEYGAESSRRKSFYCNFTCPAKRDYYLVPNVVEELTPNQRAFKEYEAEVKELAKQRLEMEQQRKNAERIEKEKLEKERFEKENLAKTESAPKPKKSWWSLWK